MATESINKVIAEGVKLLEKFNEELAKSGKLSSDLAADAQKINKSVTDNSKATKKGTDTQKELNEVQKEAEKINKQVIQVEAKIQNARTEQNKELQKRKIQLSDISKQIKEDIKLAGAQENSINKLRAANRKLRAELDNLDVTLEENQDSVKALNAQIDANTELIDENSDATRRAKGNIGKYKEDIEAALAASDKFSGGTTDIISNFTEISQQEGGIKKFFSTFVQGIASATKAGLKFILTPIGAVIFAIVAAITLFTAAIKRNQSSSDTFSKIWSGITNVIDEVVGRVFKLIGAIGKLFKGDFKSFGKEAKEAFTDLGGSMLFAFKEGQKLQQLQIDLEKSTIAATSAIAEFNAEAEKQQIIADDTTRSFKEREQAAELARTASRGAAAEQAELAKQELEIVNVRFQQAERQGKLNRELEQEQADALAKSIDAESEFTRVTLENDKLRSELRQDRLERDLDILIDGFDNVKGINERIIADDRRTFGERQALLGQTADLAKQSFDKQIETIRKFTSIQFNENELLAEQDAVILNQKIRDLELSEIIEGRLLEIIRDRRTAIQDLNDANKDLITGLIEIKDETIDLAEVDKMIAEEAKEIEEQEIADEELRMQIKEDNTQRELDLDEQKRQSKLESLALLRQIFGQESIIGRASLVAQSALAIKENLISLGVIQAKQAEGIAKSTAAAPFPANIPLILGTVAQFISILSLFKRAEIPQFAKGVTNFGGGVAELAEKGSELVKESSGKVWMAENRGLYNLKQGSTVLTAQQTQKQLNDKNIVKGLGRVEKAINRMPRQRKESSFDARRAAYWNMYNSRRLN